MNTHTLDKSEISEIIGETLDYLKQHAIIAHHEDAHVFMGKS